MPFRTRTWVQLPLTGDPMIVLPFPSVHTTSSRLGQLLMISCAELGRVILRTEGNRLLLNLSFINVINWASACMTAGQGY